MFFFHFYFFLQNYLWVSFNISRYGQLICTFGKLR